MKELLQQYLDDNKIYSFEGHRGMDDLEKIFYEVCGYSSNWGGVIENFFADNPGACQAVIEWIGNQNNTDWRLNLEALVNEEESTED